MDSLLGSKVLKDIGLDDKNQWILYDEQARTFFDYLSCIIDEDNILSSAELEKSENLKATGKYLQPGDALDEELKALEAHFPGILSITDESIEEMKRELNFLECDTSERGSRLARMLESEKQEIREIEIIEKQNIELEYQENMLTNGCLEKAKILNELEIGNQQKVLDLKQIYLQPLNPPSLCYQMPLDQHYNKCNQFLGQTEILLRRLNIKCSIDEAPENISNSSILDMKKRILEIEQKKFEEDLTIAGMDCIIQNIESIRHRALSDPHEMRLLIDNIEADNENMQLLYEIVLKEAEMLVEQAVDHETLKLFKEFFKEKNKKTFSRLETVKTVQSLTENVTVLCELLWICMQLDLDRVKNRADNSEELASLYQDFTKRMRMMKSVANSNPVASLHEFYLKKLQDLLSENLSINRDELKTIAVCLQEFVKHDEINLRIIKQNVDQELLSQLHEEMTKINDQSDVLRRFIFNGPTNQPKLYDTKYTMEIHDKEQKKKELEKMYELAKSNYKKNVVELSESDKFYIMNKNLWIYFLAEPKRVQECIKEVQRKAAERGSSSLRALSITLSRP